MGGLLRKTVKASMEDFKIALIIIHQREYMCIPSRKKIFQSISQNITNLKALSVRQSSKSRTMESSPRAFGAGKKFGRTTAVSSSSLHTGGKAESWNSTWARNETGKKKVKESFVVSLKKKNTGSATIIKPILWNWLSTCYLSEAVSELDKGVSCSLGHLSIVEKTGNFGCDDSLKELSCLLRFVKFSFAKFNFFGFLLHRNGDSDYRNNTVGYLQNITEQKY